MKIIVRAAAIAAVVTICSATLGVAAAGANPLGHSATPSAQARAAGITQQGDAYMGWSNRAQSSGAKTAVAVSPAATQTKGIDVSHWQGALNWTTQWNNGNRFAYLKATEGTTYRDDQFNSNYTNSYNAGFIRGAYHFARPDVSTGATQASYFVAHGGGWSADGKTLPGVLDIEYNPYGATCYGRSAASMVGWINDFLNSYHGQTGRWPVIYTTYDWWRTCTGNSSAFSTESPLWIARYSTSAGTLPAGYSYYTIWQWTSSPLDQDRFNGDISRVRALALG